MNTIKTFRALLASSIAIALVGCDDSSGDFKPEAQANTVAPTHGGDIVLAFNEKDEITFIDLLGTPSGASSGEGVARDADGNFLRVTDVVIEGSGSRSDEIMDAGAELNGNQLGVRSLAIAPYLDNGEMHTIVVSYNISDGVNKTPRTATLTFTGEDFAPVSNGPVVGNFTRDAGVGTVNLLATVFDADNELLTITNLVADSGNLYDLPITASGNGAEVNVDIAAVESSIPDGQKVEFKFSYTVSDHRFDIEQTMIINVLGVQDVPGAPLVTNYFKSIELDETETVITVDLTDEIVEREGDAIVVSDVMLGGKALPYGYSLQGNMLTIDPHAFLNEVNADESIEQTLTYIVSDDQGNTSDGVPELAVTLNGVETNLIASAMSNHDFEDESLSGDIVAGGNLGGFSAFGWATWWCITPTIGADYARMGNYGMRFEGRYCDLLINNIIEELPNNQKYAFSYGIQNKLASDNAASNPYVPIFASTLPEGVTENRFWLGSRYFDTAIDQWMEHVQVVSTFDGGSWDGYEGATLSWDIMKYADFDGLHYLDDFSVVAYGDYDLVAHDMLVDDVGTFETEQIITSNGGIAEIQEVEGANKLFIDTTGADAGVSISFPIETGAIKAGARYALVMEAQLINHDDLFGVGSSTQVGFMVSLSNGTDSVAASLDGSTTGPDAAEIDIIISEDYGRSADIDWSQETMMLNITFTEANAQYYVDNLRLIAIP
ncbi:hypothetical protein [Paraglaciecola arctica]|uniref:hypothetical protein n=1 Tax=Paraglaciecola arctica TaxID=1128911 RepID=UPI001C073249|nr:hypothetical protein [Paraglaciecola arctica]MBU3005413.1 hypothetical protein [Paraglaciecola arctica]